MNDRLAQPDAALEVLLGQVADEFIERRNRGERPNIEEYVRRHPEIGDLLRQVLSALQVLDPAELESASESDGLDVDLPVAGCLGDFRLLREIGRGGMGVVYEAEQISLRRRVALKVLPFAATLDARQLQRFKNEAQAAACLHHTNIVPVYGVGCERGVHYYAMQFIEGQTLAALIAELRPPAKPDPQGPGAAAGAPGSSPRGPDDPQLTGPYTPAPFPLAAVTPEARPATASAETAPRAAASTERSTRSTSFFRTVAGLGVQAAEALDHAHEQGVVHRDVKPANLLVDARGKLWITDFGLAHCQSQAGLTMTGDLVGTLRYMSPEQALAQRVVIDHRTDIYSLGATLYELLTQAPVFDGSGRQELLRQIAFEEPNPPRRINKAIPAELETIVLKALEKNPAERYATAQELADDLERWLKDEPIRARRPSLALRARKWTRRHRPLVSAAAVVLILAAVFGGGTWLRWTQLWAQRRTGAEVAAHAALDEAARLGQAERWPEALSATKRAREALAGVGADPDLRQEVEELGKDLEMARRLQEARLQGAAVKDGHFDDEATDAAYAEAFQWYGLDVSEHAPEEVAASIRASAIRTHLVAALDEWAFVKEKLCTESGEPLRTIARQADDDPWRQRLRDPQVRRDRAALERLADEEGVLAQPPANLVLLAGALSHAQGRAAAVALLRKAQQRHPADFWVNFELAFLLAGERGMEAEAVGYSRAALALRPYSTGMYNNLGVALYHQGKREEAEAAYRTAIELHPKNAQAHGNLGIVLQDQRKLPQAVAAYQKAIDLKPDLAEAHNNLGTALQDQGKLAEAEDAYRKATSLNRNFPMPHYNLGRALRQQRRLDEAIAELRTAIALNHQFVEAHSELGNALDAQGQSDEAIDEYHKALEFDPKYVVARVDLGRVLQDKGQTEQAIQEYRRAIEDDPKYAIAHYNLGIALRSRPDDAIAEYREAIRLDPKYAQAYCNLGIVLAAQGRLDGAIEEFHRAIDADPKSATAHGSLGLALLDQGQFTAARQVTQKALDLLTKADQHYPVALRQLQRCDRLLALDAKLAQILNGQAQPTDAAERLELAWLCQRGYKQLYVAALRFFEQAFTDQPALADNMQRQSRYDAACAAALAGCGRGKDAGNLSEEERTRLRRQALTWLRADLQACGQRLDKDSDKARQLVAQRMQHRQGDTDFAGVRGPEAIARLPAAERQEWQKLWEDVAALLQRADALKPPADPRPDR